ncbi:hypothetical protein SLA2020_365960 [Shorea laevis]
MVEFRQLDLTLDGWWCRLLLLHQCGMMCRLGQTWWLNLAVVVVMQVELWLGLQCAIVLGGGASMWWTVTSCDDVASDVVHWVM